MSRLTQILEDHHRHCDDSFAAAESALRKKRWKEAEENHQALREGMEAHFLAEENLLFPAFESATGLSDGPTAVMRSEHAQIRTLLTTMAEAITAQDVEEYAGQAETMLIMMQQHNIKEENILYPMCDNAISATDAPRLATELQKALGWTN